MVRPLTDVDVDRHGRWQVALTDTLEDSRQLTSWAVSGHRLVERRKRIERALVREDGVFDCGLVEEVVIV
jgi:hypothetical protein